MTAASLASVSRTNSGWVSKNHQLSPRRDNVPWLPSRSRSYTRAPDASSAAAARRSPGASASPSTLEGTWPRTLAASAATSAFARASLSRDRGDRASASAGRAQSLADDDVDGTSGGDAAPRGRHARSSSADIAAEAPERDARSPARGLVPQPPHPPGTVAPRRGGASFGRRRDPLAGAGDGAEASASAHRRRARGGPGVDLPALGRVDDDGPCEGVVRVGVVGPTVVVPRSGDA